MVTTEKITPEEQKKDEEDRKAFLELQGKFYEEQTKLKSLLGSVAGSAREKEKTSCAFKRSAFCPLTPTVTERWAEPSFWWTRMTCAASWSKASRTTRSTKRLRKINRRIWKTGEG